MKKGRVAPAFFEKGELLLLHFVFFAVFLHFVFLHFVFLPVFFHFIFSGGRAGVSRSERAY